MFSPRRASRCFGDPNKYPGYSDSLLLLKALFRILRFTFVAASRHAGKISLLSLFVRAHRHVSAPQPEFSQLVLKRLPVHAQNRRGAGYVAARFFQTTSDVSALEFAAIVAKIRGVRNNQTTVC